jgi:hypothetical protein
MMMKTMNEGTSATLGFIQNKESQMQRSSTENTTPYDTHPLRYIAY